MVHALADVLFHPHPRTARTAAEAEVGMPRHLGQLRARRAGRRNCNVNLDDRRWDRPGLNCEPQQERDIPRNLQLFETREKKVICPVQVKAALSE